MVEKKGGEYTFTSQSRDKKGEYVMRELREDFAIWYAEKTMTEEEFSAYVNKVKDGYSPTNILAKVTGSYKPTYTLTEEERDAVKEIADLLPVYAEEFCYSEVETEELAEELFHASNLDGGTCIVNALDHPRDKYYVSVAMGAEHAIMDWLENNYKYFTRDEVETYYCNDFMVYLAIATEQNNSGYFLDCKLGEITADDFKNIPNEDSVEYEVLSKYLPEVMEQIERENVEREL